MDEIERQKMLEKLKRELGHDFGDSNPVKLAIAERIRKLSGWRKSE